MKARGDEPGAEKLRESSLEITNVILQLGGADQEGRIGVPLSLGSRKHHSPIPWGAIYPPFEGEK